MISINKAIVEAAIKDSQTEIDEIHFKILTKLKKFKRKNNFQNSDVNKYIDNVIAEFGKTNFITMTLEDLERIKNTIGQVPKLKEIFAGKKSETFLKDEILAILDYKKKRSDFYPIYFAKIGIKACVYCNSQLTVVVVKKSVDNEESSEYIAKFQLDHYFPEDKYPHLSVALFNLYPVCSSCNLAKRNNEDFKFKLYENSFKKSDCKFELCSKSKALFLTTRNSKDLKILFNDTVNIEYNNVFKIDEIYKTQYDIAEEIILKSLTYNSAYRESLFKEFGKHRINDGLINRFILGNYTQEDEIHKRPFAKFMQDIGKETGLIK